MAKNILVIDDEGLVGKSLNKLLSKEGYQVTVTQSGQEAIEKVKSQDFDLIVSDVRMPQMDGIETVQEIRKYLQGQAKPAIPEILITGYADEEKYKSALNLKVTGYLFKPFDANEFLQVIKRSLDVPKR